MGISFEKALGIHPEALNFRVERSRVLASNLANADTPNYAARDLEFRLAVPEGQGSSPDDIVAPIPAMSMTQTEMNLKYRQPYQVSRDGNTVEAGIEQARVAENSMDFQTSLEFLNNKFNGLATAIDGK
ncbi:flagellar basal body rod protein FlgB [Citrobacter sp. NCU1]|uniref:flagellar basal body rod protein FlgB n=1 Tax=Citrobacter sp. NCU1 TaxID=2026683 RepID=UPI001390C120|nr:flagellar basal body rod protein FlgB [Citrobacter sp. NCU1]NDO81990.1 flagellar basal body rod protein FlgB [Citrobacter sp. NCU1]